MTSNGCKYTTEESQFSLDEALALRDAGVAIEYRHQGYERWWNVAIFTKRDFIDGVNGTGSEERSPLSFRLAENGTK